MRSAALLFAAVASGYAGFALLALAQKRNWIAVAGTSNGPRRALLRRLGAVLIAALVALAVVRDGASFGALLSVLIAAATAVAVAFTLAWRPAALRPISALFAERE